MSFYMNFLSSIFQKKTNLSKIFLLLSISYDLLNLVV